MSVEPAVGPPALDLTPATRNIADAGYVPALTPHQLFVYALLRRTFDVYRAGCILIALGLAIVPMLAVVGAILGFVAMLAACACLGWLGQPATLVLHGVPFLVLLYARALQKVGREKAVGFLWDNRQVDRLVLGRIDDAFRCSAPGSLALFLGVFFGFQHGLLYGTAHHGGLDIEGGFWECFFLTLDNVFHGISLNTLELWDVSLAGTVKHGWWSALGFELFRLAYGVLVLLMGFELYQRWSMRFLFENYPKDNPGWERLADWLLMTSDGRHGWPRRYFDELVFLVIAGHYLRGNYPLVRQLTQQFSRIRVEAEVRVLFIDERGNPIFEN